MMSKSCFAAALAWCALASGQPLRNRAERHHVRIGTAVNPARLSDEQYTAVLTREFDQIEPENAMKFGPVHPAEGRYNFAPADQVVAFALDHKMAVRGHTLVWHNQNAPWVASLAADALVPALHEHIRTVVGHFAGKVYAWDVVNEAFMEDGAPRKTVWSGAPDYIEQAFQWAHDADPKALLFYNDYGAEGMNAKSDAIYKMAQDFKQRKIPLNGVGLQMHLTKNAPPAAEIEANIKRLTDLGLEVQFTELDVRIPVDASGVASPADLEAQAKIYHDVVAACLKFPKCTAIQLWGFTDRYSWIPGRYRGFGAALPFDRDYKPKAAYDAIAAAMP